MAATGRAVNLYAAWPLLVSSDDLVVSINSDASPAFMSFVPDAQQDPALIEEAPDLRQHPFTEGGMYTYVHA